MGDPTSLPRNGEVESVPSSRGRWLDFRSLDPDLRILAGLIIAQVVAGFLLLLFRPDDDFLLLSNNPLVGTVTTSSLHYYFSCAFFLVGAILFAGGLMQADRKGVIAVLSILGVAYALLLTASPIPRGAQINLLGELLIVGLLGASFPNIWALAKTGLDIFQARSTAARPFRALFMITILVVMSVAGVVFMGMYVFYEPESFVIIFSVLRGPLEVLFYMAAIDWAEIVFDGVRSVATRFPSERGSRLVGAAIIIVLLILCLSGYYAYLAWYVFILSLIWLCGIAGAVLLLLRIARFQGNWSTRMPWPALVLVVGSFLALRGIVDYFSAGTMVDLYEVAFIIAASFVLIICCRQSNLGFLAPTMLFAVLLGVAAFNFDTLPVQDFVVGLNGVSVLFAISLPALVILGLLLAKREDGKNLRYVLSLLLILLLCLAGVACLVLLYAGALKSSDWTIVQAAVVLSTLIWEILVSGHEVTNVDSNWFSRRSRIFLFFSFVTFTLASALLWGPAQGEGEGLESFKHLNDPEYAVLIGLNVAAPAMLWAIFILHFGRWRAMSHAISAEKKATIKL